MPVDSNRTPGKNSDTPLIDYLMREFVSGLPSYRFIYSDTPLIDHLVMREFVSGPPSYRFIYERVRDRKPSLRKGSFTNSLMTKWSMSGVSLYMKR